MPTDRKPSVSGSEQVFIREVFIIKTEEIDVFGAIVRKSDGGIRVTGRVLFRDGTYWGFDSPKDDQEALRKMLVGFCRRLADFYGAEVFNMKFRKEIRSDEFIEKLRQAKSEVVFH